MATLIAAANGNLTNAATWQVADTTSANIAQSGGVGITTTVQRSSTFTPGAITIDAILVRLQTRVASPTGTVTIRLDQGTTAVAGTSVTVNAADFPTANSSDINGGWHLLKFAAPVTLAALTAYSVAYVASVSSQVTLYLSGLSGTNIARLLRTTTTAAPAAGDDMYILGEKTGAGAMTTRTVTMDQTAPTDYGNNTTGNTGLISPAISISQGGSLVCGTTAATNYLLRVSGQVVVYNGGTLTFGASGAEIPRNSTAWLEFDCLSNVAFGLTVRSGGTYQHYGLSRTAGKNVWRCQLNTDEAVASTSLGVDTDTGWLDNDAIAVGTTSKTITESERGALNGAAGASTLTVDGFAGAGGGLAFAHTGTAPVRAEVLLLTRNTGIRAVSSSFTSFVSIETGGICSLSWCEFYYLGSGGTGALVFAGAVNATLTAVSIHDCTYGINMLANNTGVTVNSLGVYLCTPISVNVGSNAVPTLLSNIVVIQTASNDCFTLDGAGGAYTNLKGVGGLRGFTVSASASTFSYLESVAGSVGIYFPSSSYLAATISNLTCQRNGTTGVRSAAYTDMLYIDTITIYGTDSGSSDAGIEAGGLRAKNVTISGEASFPSARAILSTGGVIEIDGGSFGASGAHTSSTVSLSSGSEGSVILKNCLTADTVDVTGQSNWSPRAHVGIQRRNQVDGAHMSYCREGKRELDATVYDAAAPSEKLTPRLATEKLHSGHRLFAANDGDVLLVAVSVRKNASYAGAQPRLMLRANAAMGANDDTVLDTMTVGLSTWESLTAALPAALDDGAFELYVDCDGTAGAVNVDDWAAA